MTYEPPRELLDSYAEVLINFALGGGGGIKTGEVVLLRVPESAKPLLLALERAVLKAGGHYVSDLIADGSKRQLLEVGSDEQIGWAPERHYRGLIDEVDHTLRIVAESDPEELSEIEARKVVLHGRRQKAFWQIRSQKEDRGELTWTVGLYGTPAMAKRAGVGLEAYWRQIARACFLDTNEPIREWRRVTKEVGAIRDRLNELAIERVHVQGDDVDLWVKIGAGRRWEGGAGANVPSFEVFTSPDWRGTEGWIRFDQPLTYFGPSVEGILLRFEKGEVTKATAEQNEELLKEVVATDAGSKRVGEFSLTDRRHSKIDTFMAETLYDENFGGEWGNTHIALGTAYRDLHPGGNPSKVSEEEWDRLGYNESQIHVDIISTSRRRVTAELADGSEQVIYEDGEFKL